MNKIEYVVLINQSNKIEYGYRRLNGKEISIPPILSPSILIKSRYSKPHTQHRGRWLQQDTI
ncbi:MAG: hypothetical protein WB443_01645 [Nitrososphaeraceae archaeon]